MSLDELESDAQLIQDVFEKFMKLRNKYRLRENKREILDVHESMKIN